MMKKKTLIIGIGVFIIGFWLLSKKSSVGVLNFTGKKVQAKYTGQPITEFMGGGIVDLVSPGQIITGTINNDGSLSLPYINNVGAKSEKIIPATDLSSVKEVMIVNIQK